MSNRNFDSRVIIQRLRDKNMAQNFAQFQQNGQSIINNPQTSDPSPQRIGQYYDGAGTAVVQNLLGGGYTVDLGATANFTPSTPPVSPMPLAPTITSIIGNHKSLVVQFTQTPVSGITITNYEYSTDGGITYMAFASPSTTSPLIITAESSDGTTELVNGTAYSVVLKALTATQTSGPSNIVTGTPNSTGLSTFTDVIPVEPLYWDAPADIYRVEYLLVGGGGGGGGSYDTGAGAGGGGGLALTGMYDVIPGTRYTIRVGDGGDGGTGTTGVGDTDGSSGAQSEFDAIIASGGGGGGRSLNDRTGAGGAIGNASTLTAPTGGKGGRGPQNNAGGGGGGGMGSAGSTATSGGGAGGTGIVYSISGSPVTYASGGTGGIRNVNVNGSAGSANTGNGGGGSGATSGDGSTGGTGGSGIVIIKY